MLPTKRILPLSLLLALAVWGGGTGGCSCEDEDPPAVGVSKCPQGCPIGQVCDELGALGCYIPGGSNNTNNPNNPANNNPPTCEDGCAAPEPTCEGDTAVSFSGAGECKDGACDFTAVRVEEACDLLCNAGACTTGEAGAYCTSDTHCGEGLYCDVELKECASGCRLDGCEAGSFCDPESRACVSECAADANEPNDAAGEETALAFTVGQVASYDELTLCDGDVDLYTIVLSETQDVAVLLEAPSSGGNLSAALLDPSGAEVVADADARDLQLTAMSMSAGTWTLRVTHGDNAAPATYSVALRVTDRDSDACVADLFEPNNTAAAAAELDLEYGNTRALDDLTLCEGDVDQFSLEAGVGDTLNLSFDPVPAEGLSVRVLNTDTGSDVFQGSITTAGTESWVLDEGEHIIVVSPTAPVTASGLEYGMRALLDAGAVQCADDTREDNDVCADAFNVASPGAADLVLCDDDSADWYSVFVPANQMVNLEAVYTGRAEGTFTMIVYAGSCNGEPAIADRAECADGTCERLPSALNPLVDTTYYVQIQTANASGPISYDLNVAVSGCAPDRYEPNNVNGGDVSLPTTCRAEGGVCPGDNDFFKIEVGSGETFSVAAYHNRLQDGDVDLTLYNDMLQIVDTSWTNNDRCEGVDNGASLGGTTYYLRVEVPEGVRNVPYRLVWNGACTQPENQTIPICP